MSLNQLLSLGRKDSPPKKWFTRPTLPDPSLAEDQVELYRAFEEERQQEWAERRIWAQAMGRREEKKALEVASDLAHVVTFGQESFEEFQRQHNRRRRGDRSASSGSSASGSSSASLCQERKPSTEGAEVCPSSKSCSSSTSCSSTSRSRSPVSCASHSPASHRPHSRSRSRPPATDDIHKLGERLKSNLEEHLSAKIRKRALAGAVACTADSQDAHKSALDVS
mmetsp:Transcript_110720/g.220137  ORF Transcript_110720/g.220137 Transcript_110720/m.220137 type:complete len:224 (+) Transcript_110720:62-733(+)